MIVGATRFYSASLHLLKWTLPPLVKISDRQVIMFDRVPDAAIAGLPLPAGAVVVRWDKSFDHREMLDVLFRAVDGLRPEWVVYPDSDEILPVPQFPGILDECKRQGKRGVMFRFAEVIGDFDYMLDPVQVPRGPHMRALLWKPGLTFHGTPGFCVPQGYWGDSVNCHDPLLHLCWMTRESREARRAEGRPEPFDSRPTLVRAPAEWAELYSV